MRGGERSEVKIREVEKQRREEMREEMRGGREER